MKKIFIAAIAMISAMTANAQVEQGKLIIYQWPVWCFFYQL